MIYNLRIFFNILRNFDRMQSLFEPSSTSLHVTILLLPDSSLMSLSSILDTMRATNRISKQPRFHWHIMTPNGQSARLSCHIDIPANGSLDNAPTTTDLLIIIAGFNQSIHINEIQLKVLKRLCLRIPTIVAIDAGSWLLARADLLHHHEATIHWEDFENFSTTYPLIKVRPSRFVIDGKYITTGGASPSFDFMLYLIQARYGSPLAMEVASAFIYDVTHSSTDVQSLVSLTTLEHNNPRVAKAVWYMQQHLDDPIDIASISQIIGLSKRMLEILFQQALQTTPHAYYLRLRLQAARRLVLDTKLPMQEVAIRTGFNSLPSFSRRFSQTFGVTARKLRQQHTQNKNI